MAKIGMVGMGKLGLPVALAWASKGHDVVGYDVSPHARAIMASRKYPHREQGAQRLLDAGVDVRVADTLNEVVAHADIVFLAVQTPHQPEYEGRTRMPEQRADFDYTAVCQAALNVAEVAKQQKKHIVMVMISTMLPGTSEREILPLINEYVSYVYSPLFIAQSTVVEDAFNPEFVLLGVDKSNARGVETVKSFFLTMHPESKLEFMDVASAELTKVGYNVLLGLKIVAANSMMEISHKVGADVDKVMGTLKKATDRLISPKYLNAGMGDGGGCHPRDQIALSFLARKLDLSYDLFGSMVRAREMQTQWLAELCLEFSDDKAPLVILGKAFKRGTNLVDGSPALLLVSMLEEHHRVVENWDPYVDGPEREFTEPAIFFVGTDHDEFFTMTFPWGSVVIDPWGKMADRAGVKVVRVGRK